MEKGVEVVSEDGKRHLRVLTNSEMRTFRRCAREHHLAYRLGYRPVEKSKALRFGTLIHKMLEVWWRGACDIGGAIAAAHGEECDPFDLALARALMFGYHARWSGETIETVGVEVEFRAGLVNPTTGHKSLSFELGGKVDGLARVNGKLALVEHKTTSQPIGPGDPYWRARTMDTQLGTYIDGVRSLGHEVESVLFDVIRKSALRPLEVNSRRAVAETPEEYEARVAAAIAEDPSRFYQRGVIVRLEAEEQADRADRWQIGKAILFAEATGFYPRNADACERFGSVCPYFGVCTGTQSLDDPFAFRKATQSHEELSHVAA